MAKDEAEKRIAALVKLMPLAKDLVEKLTAVVEECDEILGGGASIGAKVAMFKASFDAGWCERYARGSTGRYLWRNTSDVPNIKRLIKALGLEELTARGARFLQNEDPYIVKARHPFGLFVSGINSYAAPATAPADFDLEAPTVSDCRHQPRCKNDQEHTRRKMQELGASGA